MTELLDRLAAELTDPDDPVAIGLPAATNRGGDSLTVGTLVGSGPCAAGHPADLALVAEAVREGHLMHRGRPRLISSGDDDLTLLAGDRCYALGLERLAAVGDLDAIEVLAQVIARSAEAMAGGDEPLADALWEAAAFVLGWGARADLVAAAAAAAAGTREQLDAVLAETRERLAIDARPDSCTIENARRHRPR